MSIAAVAGVGFGSESAATPFQCSAEGCVAWTDGHFCIVHTATCEGCGDEHERGTLVRGLCGACLRPASACCDREPAACDCHVDFWGEVR